MKKLSLVLAAAVMFVAQSVSAQIYAPMSVYYPPAASCVSISRDLSVGSRGTDVLNLQRFIVSRNYPGGGAWMVTGYFGAATRAGVINFQMDSRLPLTGFLDVATRSALTRTTCGNSYPSPTYPTNPWYPTYPTTPTYPTPANPTPCTWYTQGGYSYNSCGNNYTQNNSTLSISYLSPNSGAIGSSVTVYGSGFSYTNNAVRFGNGIIAGLNSIDGRTLTFTVPATLSGYGSSIVTPGVYTVSVTNSSGATSNATSYTVTSYGNNSAPTINSVSGPTNLAIHTQGTWTLNITNNQTNSYVTTSVNWGDTHLSGAALSPVQTTYSQGSQTQTFTHAYANAGTYTAVFKVTGANGLSNTYTATVTVSGTNNPVMISNISPTSVRVGQQILLTGTGFNGDNTVRFGVGGQKNMTSMSGNYIYYTIPQYVSPCDVVPQGSYCAQYQQQIVPGQYQIYVTNSNGTSNTLTLTVMQ